MEMEGKKGFWEGQETLLRFKRGYLGVTICGDRGGNGI